jgi:hypothetical protein
MVNDTFHPFPQLPLELREEIWRLCLPHRVYEIDDIKAWIDWENTGLKSEEYPCSFVSNKRSNIRPPLLTRVCRESRRIAFVSGRWISVLRWRDGRSWDTPCEADWNTGNVIDSGCWEDTSRRDSAHMNWSSCYDIDCGPVDPPDHPLTSLAEEALRLNGTASFMLYAMNDSWERHSPNGSWHWRISTAVTDNPPIFFRPPEVTPVPQREQNLAALRLLPEWLVVVKIVVIHLDLGRAADSGLFGLLGDEIVQVVDAALPLASRLYELAEYCERGASAIKPAQDFTRMSWNDMDALVKRTAFENLEDDEIGKRLRPAILFRLCTEMCNHVEEEE